MFKKEGVVNHLRGGQVTTRTKQSLGLASMREPRQLVLRSNGYGIESHVDLAQVNGRERSSVDGSLNCLGTLSLRAVARRCIAQLRSPFSCSANLSISSLLQPTGREKELLGRHGMLT